VVNEKHGVDGDSRCCRNVGIHMRACMSHRLTDSKKMFKSSKDRQYSFEDFNCLEYYRFAKRVFNEDQEYQVT
jgi:hypothetical protein